MIAFLIWLAVLIGLLLYLVYLIIGIFQLSLQIRKDKKILKESQKEFEEALAECKRKTGENQ